MSTTTDALHGPQTTGVVDIQTNTDTTSRGLVLRTHGGRWDRSRPSRHYGAQSGPVG